MSIAYPRPATNEIHNNNRLDVLNFVETSCRCVCTFDGVIGATPDADFIERNELAETTPEELNELIFRREMSFLHYARDIRVFDREFYIGAVDTVREHSIMVVNGRVVIFKKKNIARFLTAMRAHEVWSGSAYDTLAMVTKWDRTRPVIEELIIMGLFGDFQPCQSKNFSFDIMSPVFLDRLKNCLRITTFSEEEKVMLDVFKQAYELYICMT